MGGTVQRTPTSGFNIDLTPLTKRVLSVILGLYVAQLIAENWLGLGLTT